MVKTTFFLFLSLPLPPFKLRVRMSSAYLIVCDSHTNSTYYYLWILKYFLSVNKDQPTLELPDCLFLRFESLVAVCQFSLCTRSWALLDSVLIWLRFVRFIKWLKSNPSRFIYLDQYPLVSYLRWIRGQFARFSWSIGHLGCVCVVVPLPPSLPPSLSFPLSHPIMQLILLET